MGERESEKTILIVLVTVAVVLVVGAFSMMAMMGGYDWSRMGSGMMGWGGMSYGWWMPLGGLVFLVIIGVGLYLILSGSGKTVESRTNRGLEILKERYAKGEITEEEFKRMRKELE